MLFLRKDLSFSFHFNLIVVAGTVIIACVVFLVARLSRVPANTAYYAGYSDYSCVYASDNGEFTVAQRLFNYKSFFTLSFSLSVIHM